MKKITLYILTCLFFTSCYTLKEPVVTRNHSIEGYEFIFIMPTETLTAGAGGVYGNEYGVYGSTTTKTINPSDIITGILMREGFIRLPEIEQDLVDRTIIVNYGESGKRQIAGGLGGYTIEVTISFISAKDYSVIASGTAEGIGSTEADDIREAITRCLSAMLNNGS